MIATIDAGNTRIKWGLHDGSEWVASGAIATADVRLLAEAVEDWPRDVPVAVCCVAGERTAHAVSTTLEQRQLRPRWLRASAEACGVRNAYEAPERLGADRWAALVGAWALERRACVVVCAGTATTIDLLDGDGVFQGGAILPGFELMRQSLQNNTAQLPLAQGRYQRCPRNTDDAIVSGCLNAQAGAIERMRRQLPESAPVLLAGGAGPRLLSLLPAPVQQVEHLILEGLRCFAELEASKGRFE